MITNLPGVLSPHLPKAIFQNYAYHPRDSGQSMVCSYLIVLLLTTVVFYAAHGSDDSHLLGNPNLELPRLLCFSMAPTPDILQSCVRYNLPNSELLVTGQTHNWASEGLLCLREWQLAQFLYPLLQTHSPESLPLQLLVLGSLASLLHSSFHHLFATSWSGRHLYSLPASLSPNPQSLRHALASLYCSGHLPPLGPMFDG